MIQAENIRDAEQRRLAWRCRRGMLELDILLQRFMAAHFYSLSNQQIVTFDALLALPDNDFWALLQHANTSLDVKQQDILTKINAS